MGKHVDRQLGGKTVVAKPANIKIENQKAFKDLVEKVGTLELALQELTDKINAVNETKKDSNGNYYPSNWETAWGQPETNEKIVDFID